MLKILTYLLPLLMKLVSNRNWISFRNNNCLYLSEYVSSNLASSAVSVQMLKTLGPFSPTRSMRLLYFASWICERSRPENISLTCSKLNIFSLIQSSKTRLSIFRHVSINLNTHKSSKIIQVHTLRNETCWHCSAMLSGHAASILSTLPRASGLYIKVLHSLEGKCGLVVRGDVESRVLILGFNWDWVCLQWNQCDTHAVYIHVHRCHKRATKKKHFLILQVFMLWPRRRHGVN